MARPRKYATEAEQQEANRQRQAAFRQRSAVVDRAGLEELRGLLERFHAATRAAAAAGDPLSRSIREGTPEATLRRLCEHLEAVAAESNRAARLPTAGKDTAEATDGPL